ncbi:MAG TPA: NTP transferase domain-containing protein, partial [Rariglobus sp.]
SLLRGLGITDLILSGRAGTDYARILPDARVVTDPVADAGPLAGLAAVLAAARHPWVLVLAVDLPCMSAAYLQNLLRCGNGLAGVAPHGPHGYEPLAALYPQNILPRVENALAERRWGLQGLLQGLIQDATIKALEINQADLALFANWNTPEDTVGNLH